MVIAKSESLLCEAGGDRAGSGGGGGGKRRV